MQRRWVMVVVGVVSIVGAASAEPARASFGPSCQRAAARVSIVIEATAHTQALIARRCEKDRWSADARLCLTFAPTAGDGERCLDHLARDQRVAIEGDADRAGELRLQRWLLRRGLVTSAIARPAWSAAPIQLAVLTEAPTVGDVGKARLLHKQGVSAYQAGRYELSVRKLAAALEQHPTPELLYQVAQAYRLKGDRTRALEHYERYLEAAPEGAAATACRAQIEKLRDDVP